MPMRKLLEGSAFTPEEVRELTRVYHEVVTALALESPLRTKKRSPRKPSS